eukprot:539015_1
MYESKTKMKGHKEEQTFINKITQYKYIYMVIFTIIILLNIYENMYTYIPLSIKVNNDINRPTVSNNSYDTKCRLNNILLLPIIDWRADLGMVLSSENKTHGLEIGVQSGAFSQQILQR